MSWADKDYKYKKKITIDNTKVAGNETDFPVLVSITDGDLADTSNGGHVQSSNGYDIVFYDSTESVLLDHEIQRYINTTGEIIMWVRLPNIYGAVDTVFYMYFGKPGVVIDPSTTSTWDANYVAVYHMKDITTSTIVDSTINGNDGTKSSANNPIQADGKIGYAQDFSNDVINCGNDNSLDVTNLTVEAWFNAQTLGVGSNSPRIAGIELSNSGFPWAVEGVDNNKILLYINVGAGEVRCSYIPFDWAGGTEWNTWFHGAWTFTSGSQTAYKNTVAGTSASRVGSLNNQNYNLRIGNSDNGNRDWDGLLDEIRISDMVRSANWITTCYNNQNSPSTFMGIGGVITKPATMTLTGTMHFE